MMMPAIFKENLFDEMMNFPWRKNFSEGGILFTGNMLKT